MKKTSFLLEPKTPAPATKQAEVQRLKPGGSGKYALHVSIHRPDHYTYHWASGAGIARVLERLNSDVDFLMITCFRPSDWVDGQEVPRSKTQNKDMFTKMPGELRSLLETKLIGAYWMIGHWTEKDKHSGAVTDNLEYSWLFTKDDDKVSAEQWMDAAKKLTARYQQTSFLVRVDGEMTQRSESGQVQKALTTYRAVEDAWANLAKLRANMDADPENNPYGYSELRKVRERGRRQPLTFSEVDAKPKESAYRVTGDGQEHPIAFFMAVPDNISAKQAFHALGVRARPPV